LRSSVSLIYRTEPKPKKWKKRKKLKKITKDMLISIGKQSGWGIHGVSPEEEEGYDGKNLHKRKVLILE